jgi:Holliday junction resolvase
MAYAKKIDRNQPDLVNKLRQVGCTVFVTSSVGRGFPDLVVGIKGFNFLFEVKEGALTASRKKLTPDEQRFFDTWKGKVHKVESFEEILNIINKAA